MIKLFRNSIDYLESIKEYLISLGYEPINQQFKEIIPKEIFRASKFNLNRYENHKVEKQIELYTTSKNTICSFMLLNLKHSNPHEQYCNPQLTTNLGRLTNEGFNHFETFGFEKFGKKQFKLTKLLIENNIEYLITDIEFPIGNIEKYPGFTDLCNVKFNLNEVMNAYGYKIIIDPSQYNPMFTKPHFWYSNGKSDIKFVRIKSRDENYMYAVEGNKSIEQNIFHFGTYETGKIFSQAQWLVIKSELHTILKNKLI